MPFQNLTSLPVSTMHNIGRIIVPCFTILCNVISFVYPIGLSIVTLMFIFLINSIPFSGNPIFFSSLQASFSHSLSKHYYVYVNRIYLSFL